MKTEEMNPLLQAVIDHPLEDECYRGESVKEMFGPVEYSADPMSPALRFPYLKDCWLRSLIEVVSIESDGSLCVFVEEGDYGRLDVIVARERPRVLRRVLEGATKAKTKGWKIRQVERKKAA